MSLAPPPPYRQNESLVARYQAGDRDAAEALLAANGPLIYKIAHFWLPRSGVMELEDLAQEGRIGLLHAADRFDPTRGHKFVTMATYWVRQAVARAVLNQAAAIRIPSHRARAEPLPAVTVSLDDLISEDGDTTRGDLTADPVDVEVLAVASIWSAQLLDTLPPQERTVLEGRLGFATGDPETLQAIGAPRGISRERVRQIETKALRRLREALSE